MDKLPKSIYKIRFTDCDMFGHLNNSRYLDYLINAREDHLKDFYQFDFTDYYKKDLGWVIGSHEIVYLRPAVYNEKVVIQSALLQVENDRLHLETIMLNENETQLKSVMRTRLIPVNIKTGRKTEHDPEFMSWANELVHAEFASQELLNDRILQLQTEFSSKKNANTN